MTILPETSTIGPENYRLLQEQVYAHSGIVLEQDKHYLLVNRLSPLVRELGMPSIDDLCTRLRASGESRMWRQVAEAMTTNETYFFRDPKHYEAIRCTLLPRLREEHAQTRQLRFWSAAASTGQEAYSLAMLLLEEGFEGWNIQILATDFSGEVLERARKARYRQLEVNRGLPAPLLVKYFRRDGLEWELAERVRRMVRFESIDLRRPMSDLGPFDLVFCRNVLIYFDSATRAAILKEIAGTLFRHGWLFLGGAETAFGFEDCYERVNVADASVYVAL